MGIVYVIGLALFCILFLVALGFSIKSWRWLNIVAMLFVFAAAITFTIMFAHVMRYNYEGRAAYHKFKTAYDKIYAENQQLVYGPADSTEWPAGSMQGLNHHLQMTVFGRGRVWRNCQPAALNNGQVVVTTFVPGAVLPDGTPAPVTPNNIRTPSLVFVFKQGPPDANGWEVPEKYLGEFQVTKADDQTATLVPAQVFDEDKEDVENAAGSKWTLYEMMPGDMHKLPGGKFDLFTGAEAEANDPNSEAFNYEKRRSLLETKYLTPEMMDLAPNSDEYINLIDRYAFDGMSLGEIAKIKPGFTPSVEEVWVKIEALKDFPETDGKVDSDATTTDVTASEDFDDTGLAKTPALQHGGFIAVKKGDELLVDRFTGLDGYTGLSNTPVQSLVDRGLAKEVDQVFLRTLNDYGTIFHTAKLQEELIRQETGDQRRHVETLAISTKLTAEENEHREKVVDALDMDGKNLQKDLDLATAALDNAKLALNKTQARLKELDKIIADSIAKYDALEAQWVREADERTRKAAELGLATPVAR